MAVIVLILASAAVGALGLVLLRKATQAEPERPTFSLTLLWLLIRRRPVWTAGIATVVAAFVLQGFALANGPVSLVQMVVVMELPLSLILSRLILGGRLRAREWSAITARRRPVDPSGEHGAGRSRGGGLLGAGLGASLLAAGALLLASSPLLDGHQEAPDNDNQERAVPHAIMSSAPSRAASG